MKNLLVFFLLLSIFNCSPVQTPGSSYGDVQLKIEKVHSDQVLLNWDPSSAASTVFYRRAGEHHWQSCAQVFERPYSLIFLQPDTRYQIRVRLEERPQRLSPVQTVTTAESQERSWQKAQLCAERPLEGFIPASLYPAVEIYQDKLYSVEMGSDMRAGQSLGLYLSVYDRQFQLLEQKRLVEATRSYIGIQDATLHQDKLYVTWNDIELAENYYRMGIGVYDFDSQEFDILLRSQGAQTGARAWEGGIQSWRDKLWVVSLDQVDDPDGGVYSWKTQIVLRQFDPDTKCFADSFFIDDGSGSSLVYGPSISVFGDELIILYSDLQPFSRSNEDVEPLYAVFFDGKSFHDRMLINDQVRNRYAKGVQYGDRFWLVYKSSMNYPGTDYFYHDIALSTIQIDSKNVETTVLVQDRKYNSSPDLAIWGDALIAVYNKLEHLYTNDTDPAERYGCFVAEIHPEE
ncbi:MAG TPA: fibronectin type III domain-containing protein [bacterium]|nr:fibronectin type III domain-containing protein [bacterium]HPG46917.1 fibronectin type III domain-containing protein [bacterium]HPM99281.1 fibronectin type III domain-containing protein [bacterium]